MVWHLFFYQILVSSSTLSPTKLDLSRSLDVAWLPAQREKGNYGLLPFCQLDRYGGCSRGLQGWLISIPILFVSLKLFIFSIVSPPLGGLERHHPPPPAKSAPVSRTYVTRDILQHMLKHSYPFLYFMVSDLPFFYISNEAFEVL